MASECTKSSGAIDFSQPVPIFPLPNVVLLPGSVMPLHVFEPRYQRMVRDALRSRRLIAMALLKQCSEAEYFTLDAEIHPVVSVGHIIRDERLEDGRYNILLYGLQRAGLVTEDKSMPYRRAWLSPIANKPVPPEVERAYRCELYRLLVESPGADSEIQARWNEVFVNSDLGFAELLDAVAAGVLRCCDEKQTFLAECCASNRARLLCAILETAAPCVPLAHARRATVRPWPPRAYGN